MLNWYWCIAGALGFAAYILLYIISITFFSRRPGRNPFVLPSLLAGRQPITPDDIVNDDKVRDSVLKQNFTASRVPDKVDAIVIGSGIGGLSAACLLAKARKRVLVLEQHDVLGGCCHTFVDKGYEFDVGIHYIGDLHKRSFTRTLIDQLTDCKLQWQPMDSEEFDVVAVGDAVRIGFGADRGKVIRDLQEKFPEQSEGIKQFFNIVNDLKKDSVMYWALKVLPLRLSLLLARSGLMNYFSPHCRYASVSLESVLNSTVGTECQQLRTVLSYCFGDYGVAPDEAPMLMHAMLLNHYQRSGAYYPIGGASEIAFNMVPCITKSGGRALVRARVQQVTCNAEGKATGVQVQCPEGTCTIEAPLIISAIGLKGTSRLLPEAALQRSRLPHLLQQLKPGVAAMSTFVGLRVKGGVGSLGIKRQNLWLYPNEIMDLKQVVKEYEQLDLQEAAATDPPFLFASFPSLKDPNWSRKRGDDRLTCVIVSLANWDWFSQWHDGRVKHRGSEYNSIKEAMGRRMWEIIKSRYPQLEEAEVELLEVGTPLSNEYYLGAPTGEIYGLNHDINRMRPSMAAQLRPDVGVPGLLMSGQDVAICGFVGALIGGVLCASKVLNRNLLSDLGKLMALDKKGVIRNEGPAVDKDK